jgi:catechol 2,3-dioxygenase-like lactoylglutathione lyase family enzyme
MTLNTPTTLALILVAVSASTTHSQTKKQTPKDVMPLGNFSVSLTVKDIKASRAFYEKLDFRKVDGNIDQNWLILQNGTTTIGLFQGMFEKNAMTFNPGWNHKKETPQDFQDIRAIQAELKKRGLTLTTEADESTTGPANFTLVDPDGNPILFDQHVAKPKVE